MAHEIITDELFSKAITALEKNYDETAQKAVVQLLGQKIYASHAEFLRAAMGCIQVGRASKAYKSLLMLCLKKLETLGYSEAVSIIRDILRKAEESRAIYPEV